MMTLEEHVDHVVELFLMLWDYLHGLSSRYQESSIAALSRSHDCQPVCDPGQADIDCIRREMERTRNNITQGLAQEPVTDLLQWAMFSYLTGWFNYACEVTHALDWLPDPLRDWLENHLPGSTWQEKARDLTVQRKVTLQARPDLVHVDP